jgi:HSP20 family molecular chaperone IbpA
MPTMTTIDDRLTADLIDEGDEIRLEVDVPGLEHAALDVTASGHTVTVRGRRVCSHAGHYLLLERARDFRRSFDLPHETDMRNLHARVRDGVLTISAPTVSAPCGGGHPAHEGMTVEVQPSIFACHPDAAAI